LKLRRPSGWLCLGLAICLSLALTACGGSSSSSDESSSASGYVSQADLQKYKEGSPQQTVLSWWRAVQFANAGMTITYYAPQGAPTMAHLQRELSLASKQFSGIPTFSSLESHGGAATVYFFVSRPESSSPPRAASINLVRVGDEWRLADDGMLAQVVERVEASQQPEA
jgi:hypothetical protein